MPDEAVQHADTVAGWTEEQWAQYLSPYRYEHCEECCVTLSIEGHPFEDHELGCMQHDGLGGADVD